MKPARALSDSSGMVLRREPKRLAHRAAARSRHDAADRGLLDAIAEALEVDAALQLPASAPAKPQRRTPPVPR